MSTQQQLRWQAAAHMIYAAATNASVPPASRCCCFCCCCCCYCFCCCCYCFCCCCCQPQLPHLAASSKLTSALTVMGVAVITSFTLRTTATQQQVSNHCGVPCSYAWFAATPWSNHSPAQRLYLAACGGSTARQKQENGCRCFQHAEHDSIRNPQPALLAAECKQMQQPPLASA
jgi:hypothetical protein